jgi:type IV secretory pathway VirJ component
MISARKTIACGAATVVLFLAGVAPDAPLGLRLVSEAQAVVGAPLTPGSVAGVARRTTRRTVAVVSTEAADASAQQAASQQQAATAQQQSATAAQQSATAQQQSATAQQQAAMAPPPASGQALPLGMVVSALPAGCSPMSKDGVEYQKCGPNYYRTAFQGSNLVYVTAQP